MAEYPCKICTRVKDPEKCENKTCRDWQQWFFDRWEILREQLRRAENDGK